MAKNSSPSRVLERRVVAVRRVQAERSAADLRRVVDELTQQFVNEYRGGRRAGSLAIDARCMADRALVGATGRGPRARRTIAEARYVAGRFLVYSDVVGAESALRGACVETAHVVEHFWTDDDSARAAGEKRFWRSRLRRRSAGSSQRS